MKIQRLLLFLFVSVSSGLAAAFLLLLAWPQLAHRAPAPTAGVNGDRTSSWADAVAVAQDSVVNIYTSKVTREEGKPLFSNPLFQRYFGDPRTAPRTRLEQNLGSGVVVDRNGYIITNHHVIEGADEIFIGTEDQAPVRARVVGTDPDTDLAVIQAAGKDLPPARLGDSSRQRVGDVVLAIGNPFGVGKTVTQGIISAMDRQQLGLAIYEDFIQTDAAINQGNSGGALINARGEVIGINTAILSSSGGSHGIGFAIPINLARQVMQQIIDHGRVIRGWIGAGGIDLTPALAKSLGLDDTMKGVYVTHVLENGPADLAGMEPGDVILAVDGEHAGGAYEIMSRIAATTPGTLLRLTVLHQGKRLPMQIRVLERPVQKS
ncbi:MAG TPA: trypsin-like serine protease [Thiolapillus brandeum]|uniref:Trypsin-like serine protease n=1 Tax=Thiolapillus brandeum TaxID=1076588 RepID=A0A7C5N0I6_9GAMM|nr:trypsin-like serine protease [Thiolapillus brandeum]